MELLSGVSQVIAAAIHGGTPDDYTRAGFELADRRNRAREALQELTAGDIRNIIEKLEAQQPLAESEKDYVRVWIVGDAESYLRQEQELQTWVAEFTRLAGLINDYAKKKESVKSLVEVQGLLTDALRVAADINNFLQEKDRLSRFNQAIDNLDSESTDLLVRILTAKLKSSDM